MLKSDSQPLKPIVWGLESDKKPICVEFMNKTKMRLKYNIIGCLDLYMDNNKMPDYTKSLLQFSTIAIYPVVSIDI